MAFWVSKKDSYLFIYLGDEGVGMCVCVYIMKAQFLHFSIPNSKYALFASVWLQLGLVRIYHKLVILRGEQKRFPRLNISLSLFLFCFVLFFLDENTVKTIQSETFPKPE